MRKFIYTFVAIVAYTLSTNAQNVFGPFSNENFHTVPSFFTYDHKPCLLSMRKDKNGKIEGFDIYDTKLSKVESTNVSSRYEEYTLDLIYIDENGIDFINEYATTRTYLTQTFFNDDADWEYIDEDDDCYVIKKTDDTVLGKIDNWHRQVFAIDGVLYTTTYEYDEENHKYKYYYYTIPEFRKLIFNNPDGVEAVPAMVRTVSNESYDLMGRAVPEQYKGIVVKDGKKMMK